MGAHWQQYSLIPIHKKTKRERGFILYYSAPRSTNRPFYLIGGKGEKKAEQKMADTKAKAKADSGAELTAKELKEKKLLKRTRKTREKVMRKTTRMTMTTSREAQNGRQRTTTMMRTTWKPRSRRQMMTIDASPSSLPSC